MSRRGTLLLGWALALAAMAAFAALGSWQLGRQREKQAMLDSARHVLARRGAVDLATAVRGIPGGFAWTQGSGRFAGGVRLLLDNQIRNGRPGIRLYCLFEPEGGTRPLLVDLGWLPLDGRRDLPQAACPRGVVDVRGLLVMPPSAGLHLGPPQKKIADDLWLATRIDTDSLGGAWRTVDELSPHVLPLDPALPFGYDRDLDILPNTLPPERHLGYAVQWFALAFAVLAIALVLTFRKPRR